MSCYVRGPRSPGRAETALCPGMRVRGSGGIPGPFTVLVVYGVTEVRDASSGNDEVGPARPAGDLEFVYRLFDGMPLMVIAMEGAEHRIAALTGMYRQFIGREDAVGRPLLEIFPELIAQQVSGIFDRVYATGQSESVRDFRIQYYRPDLGETVEIFLDFDTIARRGADGEVTGVMAHVQDVTARVRERQAAQAQVTEAQRRYEQARDVIDALQRELLPTGLPVLPRARIAASYLLADADTAAGGDWFDAVPMPDGRVALVVGDVVGHGVAASAAMGQLRVLLHEYLATTDGDIAAALSALDRATGRIRGARAATVCVVVLDPVTGALEYCTAGHPPLLVVSATESRYLPLTGAGPIGVDGKFTVEAIGTDYLGEGELALLYTDGILERPGRELAASTVELAQAAGDTAAGRALRDEVSSAPERVCTQTLELLTRITGHSDDITLLACQRVPARADLALRVDTDLESLVIVRERLDEWLTDAGVGQYDRDRIRHAVVELITNAIDHAHIDSPDRHTCQVIASLTDTGHLHAQVTDQGQWREPVPSIDRGLGLHLAEELVDTLRIEHDENGTTATVIYRVTTPARLLTAEDLVSRPAARASAHADTLLVLDQPSAPRPRIRVDGPIDAATVDEFNRTTRLAGVTGTRSLTMDLTGVTHLGSTGVAALHQLRRLHGDNGTALRLYAPAGTPADMILALVQIPHETHDPDYPPYTAT
jgi:serine phosphatase RsbU (regulator of sigma subunit)/anti-sigma regulatory factor (Ser/Thr protein kinase)/ABC-type transporter Mla MlaB component